MNELKFKALVVREDTRGGYQRAIEDRSVNDLPAGEVLVRVEYSSLNYKDALSATGNKGVTRNYPHTPGIDSAGQVVESSDQRFAVGDQVMVCCYDLGMNTAGGFSQYIRVPGSWVMKMVPGLSAREAMIYGTGGFTAAHSVWKMIRQGVRPADGTVLVTGASGGVGSFSVGILAREGFTVTAVSGKESARPFLVDLGATEVVSRDEVTDKSGRMVLKGRWAGVIDTVGGEILSTAIRSTLYGGVVTCCGNVADPEFSANVFPFILRGVSLLGIDSAECPMELREEIWQKISTDWKLPGLEDICTEITLDGLDEMIGRMLAGKAKGRVVIRLQG
jgi:acrylyl-CoA reductase (NADPH)